MTLCIALYAKGDLQMQEMKLRFRLSFLGIMFVFLVLSSCVQSPVIQSSSDKAAATPNAFDRVTVIFNNSKCEELRGTVLYGYKNGQQAGRDGIRPVGSQDGYRYEVRSVGMTHWRWVGSIDYSDRPENTDVVLVDTGVRPLTKEDWEITCRRSANKEGDGARTNYTLDTH